MGSPCGCGGGSPAVSSVHEVRYADGSVRRYATAGEADAAAKVSQATDNPGTYVVPAPTT